MALNSEQVISIIKGIIDRLVLAAKAKIVDTRLLSYLKYRVETKLVSISPLTLEKIYQILANAYWIEEEDIRQFLYTEVWRKNLTQYYKKDSYSINYLSAWTHMILVGSLDKFLAKCDLFRNERTDHIKTQVHFENLNIQTDMDTIIEAKVDLRTVIDPRMNLMVYCNNLFDRYMLYLIYKEDLSIKGIGKAFNIRYPTLLERFIEVLNEIRRGYENSIRPS